MLEKEYSYFLENKELFLKEYTNKFIVILGQKVIGNYSSQEEALRETIKEYKIGTFLIQKVSQNENDTTQRFFSMVYF